MSISTSTSISRTIAIVELQNQLTVELRKMESGKQRFYFISHTLRALKKEIATIDISLHTAQRKYYELSLFSSLSSTALDELDAQAEIVYRLTRIQFSHLQRKRDLKEDIENLISEGDLIHKRISTITQAIVEMQIEEQWAFHL